MRLWLALLLLVGTLWAGVQAQAEPEAEATNEPVAELAGKRLYFIG